MAFSDAITAFQAKARREALCAARRAISALHGELVRRSPVDTGRYRANQRVTRNGVAAATADRDPHGADTLRRGRDVLEELREGDVVHLHNSLPYAAAVEYGRSGQAPQGVYALSWQRVAGNLERCLREGSL